MFQTHLNSLPQSYLFQYRGLLFAHSFRSIRKSQATPISIYRALTTTTPYKMRVPYAPSTAPDEESRPIYERIAARRAPRPLQPLDLALLQNPAVADGWNSFIGAIRTKTTVPDT